MDEEKIKEAIEIGVCYVKPWKDKIRCFDIKMGYGKFVDLTPEEYDIWQQVATLSKVEQLEKLEKLFREGV